MKIRIDNIEVAERFRSLRQGVVDAIAASFKTEGQLVPIIVRMDGPKPRLVAGNHRYEAAKRCDWTEIEAYALPLDGLDPEQADVACQIVEVDENLMRGALDHAETTFHIEKRLELTNMRDALNKRAEERKAAEQARREKEEADALVKAEQDAKRKAELKKQAEKAEKVRKAAEERKRLAENTAREISNKKENALAARLKGGVTAEVAKEAGLSQSSIRNAHYYAKQLGMDTLQLLSGTRISTPAEMQALITLQKKSPKEAERVLQFARRAKQKGNPNAVLSPSGLLGEILKAEKDKAENDAATTDEGRATEGIKRINEAINKLNDARPFIAAIKNEGVRPKLKSFGTHIDGLQMLCVLLNSVAKPIDQKRTGAEHRYKGEKTAPKSEQRIIIKRNSDQISKLAKGKDNGKDTNSIAAGKARQESAA